MEAYQMIDWDVALYGMGLPLETLLRNRMDVTIIDELERIKFFDAYFNYVHKFEATEGEEKEGSRIEGLETDISGTEGSRSGSKDASKDSGHLERCTKSQMDRSSQRQIEKGVIIREEGNIEEG